MPLFLLALALSVLLWMWLARRGSSLTRQCRWRLDRSGGADHYRCAACGAETDMPAGRAPRDCLRRSD
ncbi:hypothetical protein [Szabonella alba]|uniref:Uncharacterized protein n=1 Tax=Szabonella alba TaxID=2804194 RepID=A0A8K0XYF1_9RHOB|nr:hypothetical protein [Szabonella alba]MBL4915661.1 hypothetical protein [Szabonella alba]